MVLVEKGGNWGSSRTTTQPITPLPPLFLPLHTIMMIGMRMVRQKKTKTSAKTNTNKQTIGKTPIVHVTQPITY